MKKSVRRAVIAGNWKMNKTPSEAKEAVAKTAELSKGKDGCEVILCVPFVDVPAAVEAAKGTSVKIGAQNVHFKENGAYTGPIHEVMNALSRPIEIKYTNLNGEEVTSKNY